MSDDAVDHVLTGLRAFLRGVPLRDADVGAILIELDAPTLRARLDTTLRSLQAEAPPAHDYLHDPVADARAVEARRRADVAHERDERDVAPLPLDTIHYLFVAPRTGELYGVPYAMREDQTPADLWRGQEQRDREEREMTPRERSDRQEMIARGYRPVTLGDWIPLGSPGWWGDIPRKHREQITAWLAVHMPPGTRLDSYQWIPVTRTAGTLAETIPEPPTETPIPKLLTVYSARANGDAVRARAALIHDLLEGYATVGDARDDVETLAIRSLPSGEAVGPVAIRWALEETGQFHQSIHAPIVLPMPSTLPPYVRIHGYPAVVGRVTGTQLRYEKPTYDVELVDGSSIWALVTDTDPLDEESTEAQDWIAVRLFGRRVRLHIATQGAPVIETFGTQEEAEANLRSRIHADARVRGGPGAVVSADITVTTKAGERIYDYRPRSFPQQAVGIWERHRRQDNRAPVPEERDEFMDVRTWTPASDAGGEDEMRTYTLRVITYRGKNLPETAHADLAAAETTLRAYIREDHNESILSATIRDDDSSPRRYTPSDAGHHKWFITVDGEEKNFRLTDPKPGERAPPAPPKVPVGRVAPPEVAALAMLRPGGSDALLYDVNFRNLRSVYVYKWRDATHIGWETPEGAKGRRRAITFGYDTLHNLATGATERMSFGGGAVADYWLDWSALDRRKARVVADAASDAEAAAQTARAVAVRTAAQDAVSLDDPLLDDYVRLVEGAYKKAHPEVTEAFQEKQRAALRERGRVQLHAIRTRTGWIGENYQDLRFYLSDARNAGSRAFFTLVTGVALPRTQRDSKVVIDNWLAEGAAGDTA